MTPTITWNGESVASQASVLHSQGRATSHCHTLVAASSATFAPARTLSNSAAAISGWYYIVTGQDGSPVVQTQTDSILVSTGGALTMSFPTPTVGGLILGSAMARYATAGVTSLVTSGLTADANVATNGSPANNLDGQFSAGNLIAPSSSTIDAIFTPNVDCDICSTGVEIY